MDREGDNLSPLLPPPLTLLSPNSPFSLPHTGTSLLSPLWSQAKWKCSQSQGKIFNDSQNFCNWYRIFLKDPHGELTGQNVLIVRGSVEETADHFKLSVPITEQLLSQAREHLAQVRQGRPKPQRDDKIVTAWNGKNLLTHIHCSEFIVHLFLNRIDNFIICTRISGSGQARISREGNRGSPVCPGQPLQSRVWSTPQKCLQGEQWVRDIMSMYVSALVYNACGVDSLLCGAPGTSLIPRIPSLHASNYCK